MEKSRQSPGNFCLLRKTENEKRFSFLEVLRMSDIKAMYRTVMADHFPPEMTITFGDQKLVYRKRTWKLPDSKGEVIEMGLRYGENPGQEAALYELVGGNLTLGGCQFLDPGNGLTSAID